MTNHPRSRFFHSQRLKLHYVEWGNPDNKPLILVHGGRDHCRNWDWVAQDLSRDWHIIAPDLRGHGDSQWCSSGNYTYDAYVWDLLTLLDHLKIEKANIVGHSLGGNISLRLAAILPTRVQSLVCIEGLVPSPDEVQSTHSKSYTERLRDNALYRMSLVSHPSHRYDAPEQALQHFHARNPTLTHAQAEHLTRHGLRQLENNLFAWKFDDFSRRISQTCPTESELQQLIASVSCPVLLPWGGKSFFALEDQQTRISKFRNVLVPCYPQAGHWLHHDCLDEFLVDTRRFLANIIE